MARKRPRRGEFNMAAELRNIIRDEPSIEFSDAYNRLTRRFPDQDINKSSCSVAFYNARNKVREEGRKRPAKKRPAKKRPGKKRAGKKRAAKKRAAGRTTKRRKRTVRRKRPAARSLDMNTLQAAAKFVSDVGNPDRAMAAIKQVQSLQIE